MGEIVSSVIYVHIQKVVEQGGSTHNMLYEATHETPQEDNLEIVSI